MPRTRRAANTYPLSFNKLFNHVTITGEPLIINNLPRNERAEYTSLRARLSDFRRANLDEANESKDQRRIAIAQSYYAITLREPQCVNGQWQMIAELKEQRLGDALEELLSAERPEPPLHTQSVTASAKPSTPSTPSPQPTTKSAGAIAIDELYKTQPQENTKGKGS